MNEVFQIPLIFKTLDISVNRALMVMMKELLSVFSNDSDVLGDFRPLWA